MSVTFWIPQAPVERVTPYPDMDPNYHECRVVEPFVEVNMTAGNANAILTLIDSDSVNDEEDPYGEWDQAKLVEVRRRCIAALNTEIRHRAETDPWESGGPGTGQCRVIHCGRTPDYVVRRLENFLALTKVAMDHGFNVVFG